MPIVGATNCGPATRLAEEKLEGYLKVSSRLLRKKKGIFAIKADGPSMNKAVLDGKKIEDGDYLIIDGEARNPRDGDIIVSLIDGMANVKQYRWDPANDRIRPGPGPVKKSAVPPLPFPPPALSLTVIETELDNLHFHDLRHTFATRLVQAGVDIYKVQRLLGHKSPMMTQRYTHHYPESLRRDDVEILDREKTFITIGG